MALIKRTIETLGGLWELARIGVRAKLLGGSAYWNWRRETAFGNHAMHVKDGTNKLSARSQRGAMLRFGAWVYRMKRFR